MTADFPHVGILIPVKSLRSTKKKTGKPAFLEAAAIGQRLAFTLIKKRL